MPEGTGGFIWCRSCFVTALVVIAEVSTRASVTPSYRPRYVVAVAGIDPITPSTGPAGIYIYYAVIYNVNIRGCCDYSDRIMR